MTSLKLLEQMYVQKKEHWVNDNKVQSLKFSKKWKRMFLDRNLFQEGQ